MDHEMKRSKVFLNFLIGVMGVLFIYGQYKMYIEQDKTYLPFAVEYYEFEAPNKLHIYFNREVKKEEDIMLNISFGTIAKHHQDREIKINEDTKNKVFTYNPLQQDKITRGFDQLLQDHIDEKDTIKFVSFELREGYFSAGYRVFENKLPWYIHQTLVNFEPKHLAYRRKTNNREELKHSLWMNYFKYAFGEFDSKKRKQGYWHWHYSNGSLMAEGTFHNDTLVDSLSIYPYQPKFN